MTATSNEDKLLARIRLDAAEEAQHPPTEEELLLYARGLLPDAAMARIKRYLDRTPDVAARVETWVASRSPSAFEWIMEKVRRAWGNDKSEELRRHLAQGLSGLDEIARLLQGPATQGALNASGEEDFKDKILIIFAKQGPAIPETDRPTPGAVYLTGPILWSEDNRTFDVEIDAPLGNELLSADQKRETLIGTLLRGDQQLAETAGERSGSSLHFVFHIPEDVGLDDAWFQQQAKLGGRDINLLVRQEVAEP